LLLGCSPQGSVGYHLLGGHETGDDRLLRRLVQKQTMWLRGWQFGIQEISPVLLLNTRNAFAEKLLDPIQIPIESRSRLRFRGGWWFEDCCDR
jgi:hypothetical protein